MGNAALLVDHVSKHFDGVKALTDIHLEFGKGEIVGLVGSNGAGKSTLLNVIWGAFAPNSGNLFVDGEQVHRITPEKAHDRGISIIFQHRRLMPYMTIAENIFIDKMPKKMGMIDYRKMHRDTTELLEMLGLDIDCSRLVAELTAEEKQLVEIVKACSRNPKILLMDEPTTALRQHEVETLFGIMRNLKAKGCSVVFISHRLKEVLEISDRIAVIRDGRNVIDGPTQNFTADSIVDYMSGEQHTPDRNKQVAISEDTLTTRAPQSGELLSVKDLRLCLETPSLARERAIFSPGKDGEAGDVGSIVDTAGRSQMEKGPLEARSSFQTEPCMPTVHGASFALHKGEILGLAGLGGSGINDIFDALFGLQRVQAGYIQIDGETTRLKTPRQAIAHGIGYVPEDRQLCGEFLDLTVCDNICIPEGQTHSVFSRIKRESETAASETYVDRLSIKTESVHVPIRTLSGGNQQKAVIAKWLHAHARILLMSEPTAGIDVAAKAEVNQFIKEIASEGKGILYTSSYISELMDVADRIIVIYRGKIFKEFLRDEYDHNRIYLAINGIES